MLEVKEVNVTPLRAAQMLAESPLVGQRPIIKSRVNLYVRDMLAGAWRQTGEPIILNGKTILDGQHRLQAVKQSGVAVRMLVVSGVDEDAYDAMDSGRSKLLGDVLRKKGHTNVHQLAGAITYGWRYDNGKIMRPEHPSRNQSLEWFRGNNGIIDANRGASRVTKRLPTPHKVVAVSQYVTDRVTDGEGTEFWSELVAGVNLEEGSPMLAFQRWLLGFVGKRDRPGLNVFFAVALKAMNAHRSGRDLKIVRWHRGEGIPTVWGSE